MHRRTGWRGLIKKQLDVCRLQRCCGQQPCTWLTTYVVCCRCCPARFSRTAVARVSDDYYPRDPASSTPHIGACAFNSLYLGALVQPDWDMFQSAHPAGE